MLRHLTPRLKAALPLPLPPPHRRPPLRRHLRPTQTPHRNSTPSDSPLPQNHPDPDTSPVNLVFISRDGSQQHIQAPSGKSLLEIAHANDIELEGACEGSLACSTCHVYLDQTSFDKLDEPCDFENDMLDLAFGLSELSRLGCQIKATKELDGMQVTLPPATRNMAVDGFVPKPH